MPLRKQEVIGCCGRNIFGWWGATPGRRRWPGCWPTTDTRYIPLPWSGERGCGASPAWRALLWRTVSSCPCPPWEKGDGSTPLCAGIRPGWRTVLDALRSRPDCYVPAWCQPSFRTMAEERGLLLRDYFAREELAVAQRRAHRRGGHPDRHGGAAHHPPRRPGAGDGLWAAGAGCWPTGSQALGAKVSVAARKCGRSGLGRGLRLRAPSAPTSWKAGCAAMTWWSTPCPPGCWARRTWPT